MNLTNNFDKIMRVNDFNESEKVESVEQYAGNSNARNISFLQASGDTLFISYSNLVSGEFSIESSIIILRFVYYTITLKGENLVALFSNLQRHMVSQVNVVDSRFSVLRSTGDPAVTEIIVERNF